MNTPITTPQNQKPAPICGIYRIRCISNAKVYIGQSTDIVARWEQHKKGETNKKLVKDFIKYGVVGFNFDIIETCEPSKLNEREQYWIEQENSIKYGYNVYSAPQPLPENPISRQVAISDEMSKLLAKIKLTAIMACYASEVHNMNDCPPAMQEAIKRLLDIAYQYQDQWSDEYGGVE